MQATERRGNGFASGCDYAEASPEGKKKRKIGQRMTGSRDILMHRWKAAMKFRAMSFCPAALVRQPKARRGEKSGNV